MDRHKNRPYFFSSSSSSSFAVARVFFRIAYSHLLFFYFVCVCVCVCAISQAFVMDSRWLDAIPCRTWHQVKLKTRSVGLQKSHIFLDDFAAISPFSTAGTSRSGLSICGLFVCLLVCSFLPLPSRDFRSASLLVSRPGFICSPLHCFLFQIGSAFERRLRWTRCRANLGLPIGKSMEIGFVVDVFT